MRRVALSLIALAGLAGALFPPSPALAQAAGRRPQPAPAREASGQPPHAWLFGTWTGGIFPAPSELSAEACLSQPVVIFTRDVVLRATITEQFYIQRLIETALTTTGGTQFHFSSAAPATPAGELFGPAAAPGIGFGCASPDALDVERRTNNQITFLGCADFPYPLVRCPAQ